MRSCCGECEHCGQHDCERDRLPESRADLWQATPRVTRPAMRMLVFLIALPVLGCNWVGGEKGSGTPKTEVREVGAFTSVKLEGSLRADIAAGGAQHVEISGDDNIVALMTTEVTDQRLRVAPKK